MTHGKIDNRAGEKSLRLKNYTYEIILNVQGCHMVYADWYQN